MPQKSHRRGSQCKHNFYRTSCSSANFTGHVFCYMPEDVRPSSSLSGSRSTIGGPLKGNILPKEDDGISCPSRTQPHRMLTPHRHPPCRSIISAKNMFPTAENLTAGHFSAQESETWTQGLLSAGSSMLSIDSLTLTCTPIVSGLPSVLPELENSIL